MQAMTEYLKHDLNTLKDQICQIAEFKKIIAKSFRQIVEFEKTINKSLDHITEAEKAMAKIAGFLSNEHTNKDQFAHRASQQYKVIKGSFLVI